MGSFFSRVLKRFFLALVLAAAVVCAWLVTPSVACAETFSVNSNPITVTLYYGAEPTYPEYYHDAGYYFLITSYQIERPNGSRYSLIEAGRVTASPGTYSMAASYNTHLSDGSGHPIDGHDFTGTITVVVEKNVLPITVQTSSLTKKYGDTAADLSWDFKDESDRDPQIGITFSCEGFAAGASVGSYPVTASGVTKNGIPTDLYEVVLYPQVGTGAVNFAVEPKEAVFTLSEEPSVIFNDYLADDGESVHSITQAGVNGETLTAYYHLKTPPQNLLTVGEKYEIEAYRYEVASSGQTVSYTLTDQSNYDVSFTYGKNKVAAVMGSLTVYQNEELAAARQGDATYFYPDISYEYLDSVVENYHGNLHFTLDYYGLDLTLFCTTEASYGALSCGEYPLTLISFGCDSLTSVLFEGVVKLKVLPRVLNYEGEDVAEVASGNAFKKQISLDYKSASYDFELTADVTGGAVGQEVAYTSFTSSNQNFTLDLSAAKVTLTKRSTGVSVVSLGVTSVYFGNEYAVAALYLNHGKAGETLLADEVITYSYTSAKANGAGLPAEVGEYTVACSLTSDLYEAAPINIGVAVVKRPVAGYYRITTAKKAYGETFNFNSSVQLTGLYDYNEETGEIDRDHYITLGAGSNEVGGNKLTSAGAAASKKAGEYAFDFSGATSAHYRIAAAIVFDQTANKEVQKFLVEKAQAPTTPALIIEVRDREIRVIASGQIAGEISVKSDYTGAKSSSSKTGYLSFTQLTYGQVYYLRVRAEDNENYKQPGAWSEVVKTLPFAKPDVTLSMLTSNSAVVVAGLKNAVSDYTIQHRVGSSGEWKDGVEVTGLKPDKDQTLYFRAKKNDIVGEAASLSVHTLVAPVEQEELNFVLDREDGTLNVTSELQNLEYRLLSADKQLLSDGWTDLASFEALEKDSTYYLQVRVAAAEGKEASEIAEFMIDTHKTNAPFSLAKFLSRWFLIFVGSIVFFTAMILLVVFIKVKRMADEEELGGNGNE